MKADYSYPIRVWITTLLVGSVLYWLFLYLANRIPTTSISGLIGEMLLTVMYTGLCAVPAMLVFLFVYHVLNVQLVNWILARAVLLIIGILGCTFTLAIMPIVGGDVFSTPQMIKLWFFCFPLAASILFFRFQKKMNDTL